MNVSIPEGRVYIYNTQTLARLFEMVLGFCEFPLLQYPVGFRTENLQSRTWAIFFPQSKSTAGLLFMAETALLYWSQSILLEETSLDSYQKMEMSPDFNESGFG